MTCTIDGCCRNPVAKGLCAAHYIQQKRAAGEVRAISPDRFWARVRKSDGCWEWTGAKDKDGYGKLIVHYHDSRAHRVAWELTFGPVPDGLFVLHRCDNPACCNPEHLFTGDNDANMADMAAKGRAAAGDANAMRKYPELVKSGDQNPSRTHADRLRRGESQAGSKLTDAQVREIRAKYVPRKVGLPRLAREYGVGTSTIYRVIRGTHWRHVS